MHLHVPGRHSKAGEARPRYHIITVDLCLSLDTYQIHCSSNNLSPPSPSCTRSNRRRHVWSQTLRGEDRQRTGWRDEKKRESDCLPCQRWSQTLIPVSLERTRLSLQNPGIAFLSRGSGRSGTGWDRILSYIFCLNYSIITDVTC